MTITIDENKKQKKKINVLKIEPKMKIRNMQWRDDDPDGEKDEG